MPEQNAYFVSDAHFGIHIAQAENRQELFLDFLQSRVAGARYLFLLGDVFDFWIEYPGFIRSSYFPILHGLAGIKDSGTEIHYLAGNHDFALGPFLEKQIGITVHENPFSLTLRDKRLFMHHGDGLLKRDRGYRVLRRILRNPLNQFLFKLLHPSLGLALASTCSGSSRKYLGCRMKPVDIAEYRAHARSYLNSGADIVLFGHTHHAEIVRWPCGTYCNTGNWTRSLSFASLDSSGNLQLQKYLGAGNCEPIAPVDC